MTRTDLLEVNAALLSVSDVRSGLARLGSLDSRLKAPKWNHRINTMNRLLDKLSGHLVDLVVEHDTAPDPDPEDAS